METNRNFKDSVFTALFNDPDLLRELYYALKGISLPADVPICINTLENVLHMGKYNDISLVIVRLLSIYLDILILYKIQCKQVILWEFVEFM